VAQLDTTTQTLRIGTTSYSYAGAAGVPADLAVGAFVSLRMVPSAGPRWVVQAFGSAAPAVPDGDQVKFKGQISSVPAAGRFAVDGRLVDASTATVAPLGSTLSLGTRVLVVGTSRAGVLQATAVTVTSEQEDRDQGFEITGSVASVDSAQRTFVVRGVTISSARPDLRFDNGSAADLKTGVVVEVKGLLSADRLRVEALRIKFPGK
jgi:Domain of unknown function (DUF5666)